MRIGFHDRCGSERTQSLRAPLRAKIVGTIVTGPLLMSRAAQSNSTSARPLHRKPLLDPSALSIAHRARPRSRRALCNALRRWAWRWPPDRRGPRSASFLRLPPTSAGNG
jgi:hypothetical protein